MEMYKNIAEGEFQILKSKLKLLESMIGGYIGRYGFMIHNDFIHDASTLSINIYKEEANGMRGGPQINVIDENEYPHKFKFLVSKSYGQGDNLYAKKVQVGEYGIDELLTNSISLIDSSIEIYNNIDRKDLKKVQTELDIFQSGINLQMPSEEEKSLLLKALKEDKTILWPGSNNAKMKFEFPYQFSNTDDAINAFCNASIKHGNAINEGLMDEQHEQIMIKSSVIDFLKKHGDIIDLEQLYTHVSPYVRLDAASYLLEYNKDKARNVLKDLLSEKPDNISLLAEILLESE